MAEDKVLFGSIIKDARKTKKLSQTEMAEAMGVTRSAVVNWEADKYKPEHDLIPGLCRLLHVDVRDLYGMSADVGTLEKQLLHNYHQISDAGRRVVNAVALAVLEEEINTKYRNYKENYRLYEFPPTKAAAGTGSDYIDDETDYVILRKHSRYAHADAVIEVTGDSMLPVYHDGDLVYVEYTNHAYPGEDVICTTADGGIIKRVTEDGKLMSVNPTLPYGDKSEDYNVRIIGRVLGVVSPSDIPDKQDTSMLEDIFSEDIREFREQHGVF